MKLAEALHVSPADLERRLLALADRRQYGPNYSRAVNESCRDAELFAFRGDYAAATHYMLHAERSAGVIGWDELEAADPFRAAR